jgi:hypothetical protein
MIQKEYGNDHIMKTIYLLSISKKRKGNPTFKKKIKTHKTKLMT